MRRHVFALCTSVLAAAAFFSACGSSPTTPSGSATLNVRITDSPFSDAKAFLVTFSEVRVNRNDEGWKTVPFVASAVTRTCDLKKLDGPEDVLGTGALPTGHYDQIRLQVSSASLYFDAPSIGPACAVSIVAPAGRMSPVEIPSGLVRLNREFDLTKDDATTIVLDFDGNQSLHETGNGRFMMVPVVRVVSVQ